MKEDKTPKAPRRRGDAGVKKTQINKLHRVIDSGGASALKSHVDQTKGRLQPGVLAHANKLLEAWGAREKGSSFKVRV